MNAFLGAGGAFSLAALLARRLFGPAVAESGEILRGVAREIGEATDFGAGTTTALGTVVVLLFLVVVSLAVLRRIASLVFSLAIAAGWLAWWAGWLS